MLVPHPINPRPICLIATSHKDVEQTLAWLRWVRFLANQPSGLMAGETIVVFVSRRAWPIGGERIEALLDPDPRMPTFRVEIAPDECEDGYPRSASHQFLRGLECCEREFPGRSVLFCEPDCIPLRPDWFLTIATEYEKCGHAFMGERVNHAGRTSSHITGNSCYPYNWRQLAPRIATAPEAPDHPMFGIGKGQPWDTWACEETTADLHETRQIQQIFNCPPFRGTDLSRIRPGAALFHRCKDGTLIATLARARYPEFLAGLPPPSGRFQMNGHPNRLSVLGYEIGPWKATRRAAGWHSECEPESAADELVLRCLVGSKGVSCLETPQNCTQ